MTERFASAYGAGAPRTRPFLPLSFDNPEARRAAVRHTSGRTATHRLVHVLLRQSEHLPPSEARTRNIRALGEQGTTAVVTGQQVGLFLGPLYTLYKAATAIRVARALETETGIRSVPVFWLQTEDHDFEEIATCHVPRSDRTSRALSVGSVDLERVSIAHRRFDPSVEGALAALSDEIQNLPHAEAHLTALRSGYRDGGSVAGAFAQVLGRLFLDEGLVILDPRDEELAEAMQRVHRTAIEEAVPISRALRERVGVLRKAGFKAPIHIRDGAPLSFFHPDGPGGPRYRLEPSGNAFALVGRTGARVSRDELLAQLDADPLAFSTSALLRPILQDIVLPTCAYVAGPGEIDYFAQIGPAYVPFRRFGLDIPLIVPRAHFVLLEPKTTESLRRLGIESSELGETEEALLSRGLSTGEDLPLPDALRTELTRDFEGRLAELAPRIGELGSGLDKAVEKTRAAVERSVTRFVDKYRNALVHRDEARVSELRRVMRFLRPDGGLQERHFGLSYFAARYGQDTVVRRILEAVPLFETGMRELTL